MLLVERHPLRSLHEAVDAPGSSGQFVRFLHLINLEGVVPLLFWARASLSRAMLQRPDTWKGRVGAVCAQLAQVHLSAHDYVPHLYMLLYYGSMQSVCRKWNLRGQQGHFRRGHHIWLVQPHSL